MESREEDYGVRGFSKFLQMPFFGRETSKNLVFLPNAPSVSVAQNIDIFCKYPICLFCKLFKILTFFANASFDWVVISGEDWSPLALGGLHQTLGRQVVFSLSHFFANPVSLMRKFFSAFLTFFISFQAENSPRGCCASRWKGGPRSGEGRFSLS